MMKLVKCRGNISVDQRPNAMATKPSVLNAAGDHPSGVGKDNIRTPNIRPLLAIIICQDVILQTFFAN